MACPNENPQLLGTTFTSRRTAIVCVRVDGRLVQQEITLADGVMIFVGGWRISKTHRPGDVVTYECGLWVRVPRPRGTPGKSDAWDLLVQGGDIHQHLADMGVPYAVEIASKEASANAC